MIVSIACTLRRGVSSVGVISIGRGSPNMGQHFRCKKYIDGWCSYEVATVKKADLWLA